MDVNILMLTAAILGECPIWGSKAAACCSFGRSAPGPFVLFLIPALCIVAALMLRFWSICTPSLRSRRTPPCLPAAPFPSTSSSPPASRTFGGSCGCGASGCSVVAAMMEDQKRHGDAHHSFS
ncbi:uncharacterized protein [Aegilops tauschii subsp. strangulata]|uniref:uncharacterized protein isoform X1 n=1 Tax=Aegilops tauschii subsp. strangulata TaxID=200361 RepID=UPI003CC8D39C